MLYFNYICDTIFISVELIITNSELILWVLFDFLLIGLINYKINFNFLFILSKKEN